jgi:homoserine kinase
MAARQTLAKQKIQIVLELHFVRHWPTNYKLKTPAGRKILPQNISIAITAGAGKISN